MDQPQPNNIKPMTRSLFARISKAISKFSRSTLSDFGANYYAGLLRTYAPQSGRSRPRNDEHSCHIVVARKASNFMSRSFSKQSRHNITPKAYKLFNTEIFVGKTKASAGMTKRGAIFSIEPVQRMFALIKGALSRFVIPAKAGIQYSIKITGIFTLFLLIQTTSCFSANRILAAVGKEVVTSNDLERRYRTFLKMNQATPSAEESKSIRLEILYALVNEKIINQEAQRLNVKVDENEVSQAIHHLEQAQNMNKGSIAQKNKELGISQDFREQIRNKLILEKILFDVVFPYTNSIVHDSEINEVLTKDHPSAIVVKGFLLKYRDPNVTKALNKLDSASLCNINTLANISGATPLAINAPINAIKDHRIKQMISSIKNESTFLTAQINNQTEALILCERKIKVSPDTLSQIKEQLKNKKLESYAKHYLTNLRKKRAIDINVAQDF